MSRLSLVGQPITFQARLLAEAVRHYEALQHEPLSEPQAGTAARSAGGDLEQRIVNRARALSLAPALQTALGQLRQALILSVTLLILVALMMGAAAARLAFWPLHTQPPVNVYWLLTSILGLPVLTLLVWLGLILVHPSTLATRSLAGLAHALGRRLSLYLHRDSIHAAAVRASAGLLAGTGGRWRLSALIHGLWVAYLSGALLMALVLLSVRQYSFAWETTILSASSYQVLTRLIGALPALFGFATPDAGQIVASQWHGGGAADLAASTAWSGLVLGSIVVYGILPRFSLLLVSLWLAWRARQRFRLDPDLPGYAGLRAELAPTSSPLGVIDPDDSSAVAGAIEPPEPAAEPALPLGPPAILGLEIEPLAEWPPPLGGAWLDLGHADDRSSRRQVLERLATASPRWLLVACSLAVTPDRGSRHFLEQLHARAGPRLVLLLSEGQRLRARGEAADLPQRVADWRSLGESAGIAAERIIELDLQHLTEHSRARLRAQLGLAAAEPQPSHSAAACELIVEHVGRWRQPPDAAAQAELHRAIARLYSSQGRLPRLPLPDLAALRADLPNQLQHGADRMRQLLPARLRLNPRWLAAGALSGALGCVALATLTAPAALASLPLWSAAGAALTLFTGRRQNTAADPATAKAPDFGQPVAAAALFMLLLELQGRDEAAITRALDELLDAAPPAIADAAQARTWLSGLRQRHSALLAREAA